MPFGGGDSLFLDNFEGLVQRGRRYLGSRLLEDFRRQVQNALHILGLACGRKRQRRMSQTRQNLRQILLVVLGGCRILCEVPFVDNKYAALVFFGYEPG